MFAKLRNIFEQKHIIDGKSFCRPIIFQQFTHELKASIWLWLVSVIMPIVHGYLYWERNLYADFGMEVYYVPGYRQWLKKIPQAA